MRLAIIGCGSIGMRHLKNALALGCEVYVADTDRAKELRARELCAGVWEAKQSVDALMICTPYDDHLIWADWAARHRLPFFCEKPLGSLDQIEDWRRLVQASQGLTTQVGYMLRFHPCAQMLKAVAHNDPIFVTATLACGMRQWPGQSYGDGLLECSHELDLAMWCGAGEYKESRREPTWANVMFQRGCVWLDWASSMYHRAWASESRTHKYSASFRAPDELGDQMYLDELKHFLDCVQLGRQTDVPLADGLKVLEICRQIEALSGQVV